MPTLDDAHDIAALRLAAADDDLTALPAPLQTVLLLTSAQGLLDNGGLHAFFGAEFPGRPPYGLFVAAYERIGAAAEARGLARAVAVFPFDEPHLDAQRRAAWLAEHVQAFADGDVLCGSEAVWPLLEAYVTRHADAFA